MKKALFLTAVTMLLAGLVGCNCCNGFRRGAALPVHTMAPACDPCAPAVPCDPCGGAPVIGGIPTTIMPGPTVMPGPTTTYIPGPVN